MDEVDIDARGLLCPLPVLRLRKRLQGVAEGGELTMLTDDPVAVIDVPFFCSEAGHEVVEAREVEGARFFRVRRGSGAW
ncbi:sulfurtransferase TusA family protein [Pseudooceanicola sp.]|uniref:sulfurtransferase TusA family protein n=1 Tax=Pseudooceanicola sp. TaxID=1914328 RepID=UPI0035C6E6B9